MLGCGWASMIAVSQVITFSANVLITMEVWHILLNYTIYYDQQINKLVTRGDYLETKTQVTSIMHINFNNCGY
jgi:hypothetical protein